jgi:hypothetical protein
MLRRIKLLPLLMALAGLSALAVGAGLALAHGGDATAIHGCVEKEGKAVRILAAPGIGDPNQACKSNETAIDWSQTGPQGPPGISGYEVVGKTSTKEGDGSRVYFDTVSCPAGKAVLGGGGAGTVFLGDDPIAAADLMESAPGALPESWVVGFSQINGSPVAEGESIHITSFVICAVVSS